ncbi:MAG: sulfotransferase family 2 domain-containing protein [Verrucomicrobia bacterium]|nr:sulfotransferase family 2 domain-containing protein [Verrucomicrobiota bacterium]MBT7699340.1 sulfotransferase family 2 domain-containing protein [Verrucomicrobiota bacterium]
MSKLMYFDVPKAASTTIRRALFQNKSSASLRNPKKELASYLKFTFVRNPWDRMVSNWKMFTTQPRRIAQLRTMTNEDLTEFDHFVEFAVSKGNHHWQPQVLFTPDKLDFTGKVEHFDRDMNRLLRAMGREPLELEKRNTTNRNHYHDYYNSPSTIDQVAKLYRDDIERFDYQF